jgi:hypothetical protein
MDKEFLINMVAIDSSFIFTFGISGMIAILGLFSHNFYAKFE